MIYIFFSSRKEKKHEKKREAGSTGKLQFTSRVEKEYMRPTYSASIGEGLEDGLFDGMCEITQVHHIQFLIGFSDLVLQMSLCRLFGVGFAIWNGDDVCLCIPSWFCLSHCGIASD